jgi:hypothetical protein
MTGLDYRNLVSFVSFFSFQTAIENHENDVLLAYCFSVNIGARSRGLTLH